MPRNLDMTALRSFVAVAETGGVTKAAGFLNLTQSAVSMQLKRLEESVNVPLFDRSARTIALTAAGEQLLSYARRLVSLNDEAFGRLTATEFEGEITLGVPHDVVYPAIPQVLKRFATAYPRIKVNLLSSYTTELKRQFGQGEADVILTTEDALEKDGEVLASRRIVWIGAEGGQAWKQRPLRVAFENVCIFRTIAQSALDAADIPWENAVDTTSTRTIEATVSADLAIHAMMDGTFPQQCTAVQHNGALPDLGESHINMYYSRHSNSPAVAELAAMVRAAYRAAALPMTVVA